MTSIVYRFHLPTGAEEITLDLDPGSFLRQSRPEVPPQAWSAINFHKCGHCLYPPPRRPPARSHTLCRAMSTVSAIWYRIPRSISRSSPRPPHHRAPAVAKRHRLDGRTDRRHLGLPASRLLPADGRKLGKSPAAVSRAITFLETHVGAPLLHRTTRSIRLSEAGERYAAVCRRIYLRHSSSKRHNVFRIAPILPEIEGEYL